VASSLLLSRALAPCSQNHMRIQHDLLTQLSQVVLPLSKSAESSSEDGHGDSLAKEDVDSSMAGDAGVRWRRPVPTPIRPRRFSDTFFPQPPPRRPMLLSSYPQSRHYSPALNSPALANLPRFPPPVLQSGGASDADGDDEKFLFGRGVRLAPR
jgi:hypothetical protein